MAVFLTLCLLGFLIYSNSLSNSFHLDDFPSIVINDSIRNIHNFYHLWSFWPTRIVTYFSFALSYHWGGLNVIGYHLVSVLIHVATSILVWQLMRLTLDAPIIKVGIASRDASWISFFVAAIF